VEQYITSIIPPSGEIWEEREKEESDFYLNKTKQINTKYPEWNTFFRDRDQWMEIEKDSLRTRSEMHFFVTSTKEEDIVFKNPYKL
jgi:hypothetical protein